MKTVSSGHHKVKRGWKLLAGLPKKRGRGSATTRRRKLSPASRSNCACNRPQKATLIRTGAPRTTASTKCSDVCSSPSYMRCVVVATPRAWLKRTSSFTHTVPRIVARKTRLGVAPACVGPLEGGRRQSLAPRLLAARLDNESQVHGAPPGPTRTANGSPVVIIGVGRHGVARDNGPHPRSVKNGKFPRTSH